MEMLDVIETIRAEEADTQRLFGGEGVGARSAQKRANYNAKLIEAAKLVADVYRGDKGTHYLKEAMTTSDFPYLFGDILDRQLLANYVEAPQVYRAFVKVSTVPDFRSVRRFTIAGAESVLAAVPEQSEYPLSKLTEGRYTYNVAKYGRKIPFSWEAMINDDLDALKDIPARFGKAARRSESKFSVQLYADSNGPHASFYTVGNANIVTSNPVLSITALQTAMAKLAAQTDSEGEPIYLDVVHLVVPPALEIVARNILNMTQLWIDTNAAAGTAQQNMVTENWMRNRVQLHVEPYIPIVATSNGNTSWWLFGSPGSGRPALEMGFLRGHEQPEVFIKAANASRVGGGLDVMAGDFDTDSVEYKVRHVFGGVQLDPKVTVASKGTGS